MTALEDAESALAAYKEWLEKGNPWVPGVLFMKNPRLKDHIMTAFENMVHECRVAEQAKPARRVSLSDDLNWRPSSVAPVLPGSKEWVDTPVEVSDGKDDGQHQA